MNIFHINDEKLIPDKIYEYTKNIQESEIPLIIDNGSYQCRVGWASSDTATAKSSEPMLIFRNLIAKPRKDRIKKDQQNEAGTSAAATNKKQILPSQTSTIQIGNDIVNFETIRYQLKTQFDRNVVTHYQNQEHIYDHIFTHLGINTNGYVGHPIVQTECFANPNYYRQLMSELLFECYQVPSICYGIDSIYSFYHNFDKQQQQQQQQQNGLIISCGYHTTHIIPILNGIVQGTRTRRLNIGGHHMITYLHRLLQLKYPVHAATLTLTRIEWLIHNHCTIAYDYLEELQKWTDLNYYDENIKKIQLPYNTGGGGGGGGVSGGSNSSTTQLTAEQKLERKRELSKRLADMNARRRESKLIEDQDLLQRLESIRDAYYEGEGEDEDEEQNEMELQRALKEYGHKTIDELLKNILNTTKRIERIKQKIEQSTMGQSTNFEENKPMKMANNKIPKPPPNIEITKWIGRIKHLRGKLLEKRMARRKRKHDLTKRRTAAAQERMRIISQLARKETRKEKATDDFGMRDTDWDVYKKISREHGDSDSETENEKLLEYEEILRHYDPTFEDPNAVQPEICNSPEELHQLHVGIEAIRAPELLFQPSMIGIQEGGLGESIEYVLKLFTPIEQLQLVNNVFLTGGCAKFPGLEKRLSRELLAIRPFKSVHKIFMSKNPSLDAWYGARTFGAENTNRQYFVTRQMYDEFGGDYIKEYYASNKYCPMPSAATSSQ